MLCQYPALWRTKKKYRIAISRIFLRIFKNGPSTKRINYGQKVLLNTFHDFFLRSFFSFKFFFGYLPKSFWWLCFFDDFAISVVVPVMVLNSFVNGLYLHEVNEFKEWIALSHSSSSLKMSIPTTNEMIA